MQNLLKFNTKAMSMLMSKLQSVDRRLKTVENTVVRESSTPTFSIGGASDTNFSNHAGISLGNSPAEEGRFAHLQTNRASSPDLISSSGFLSGW